MKWVALAVLIAMIPAVAAILHGNRKLLIPAGFLFGLLPFLIGPYHLSVSPIAWPTWPGPAKGTEITILDALALCVLLSTPRITKVSLALKLSFLVYVFAVIISISVSSVKMASAFYLWQLLRSVVVFLAAARIASADERGPIAILSGGIAGISIHAAVAIVQFLTGTVQAGGWLGHQNLLGMTSHFVVFPALALLITGLFWRRSLLAVVAAFVIAFTGGSRATIGLMALGAAATGLLSYMRAPKASKGLWLAAGGILLTLSAPILYSAIERRTPEARAGSNQMREQMVDAAVMIANDHPFGAGVNNYVVVANLGGYSARAGVPWNYNNRNAPIHNAYYLALSEMGWLGLLATIGFVLTSIATAWTVGRKAINYTREMSAGVAVSLGVVACHMYYEWVVMLSSLHYLWAIALGAVVGGCRAHSARMRRKNVQESVDARIPAVNFT